MTSSKGHADAETHPATTYRCLTCVSNCVHVNGDFLSLSFHSVCKHMHDHDHRHHRLTRAQQFFVLTITLFLRCARHSGTSLFSWLRRDSLGTTHTQPHPTERVAHYLLFSLISLPFVCFMCTGLRTEQVACACIGTGCAANATTVPVLPPQ